MVENDRYLESLKALDAVTDEDIDTSDLPELEDDAAGQRGRLYRPVKIPVSIRIDADVVAYFKEAFSTTGGYQTAINAVLRQYMNRSLPVARKTSSR
jgi:uncharacterized protein (DUF4415 family)